MRIFSNDVAALGSAITAERRTAHFAYRSDLHIYLLREQTYSGLFVTDNWRLGDWASSELHLNIQSVPRSKHTPFRLYKPVS
jgi:hypothetical protein